jgi:hypothetical protein
MTLKSPTPASGRLSILSEAPEPSEVEVCLLSSQDVCQRKRRDAKLLRLRDARRMRTKRVDLGGRGSLALSL